MREAHRVVQVLDELAYVALLVGLQFRLVEGPESFVEIRHRSVEEIVVLGQLLGEFRLVIVHQRVVYDDEKKFSAR